MTRWATTQFTRLLDSNSSLGGLVRKLTFFQVSPLHRHHSLPFSRLTNRLRTLVLQSLCFNSWDQLFYGILPSLPTLKSLICDWAELDEERAEYYSVRCSMTSPQIPVLLISLVVNDGDNTTQFAQAILKTRIATRLRNLRVSLSSLDDHLCWVPVIHAACHTLQRLRGSLNKDATPAVLWRLRPSDPPILCSTQLPTSDNSPLCLSIISPLSVARYGDLRGDDILVALNTVLEHPPAPLPSLRSLTLQLVDRGQALDEAPIARLADSLASRTRYPSFRHSVVVVKPQKHLSTGLVIGEVWIVSKPPRSRRSHSEMERRFLSFREGPRSHSLNRHCFGVTP
ncbi:hypothetical protein C8Q80DRAFT_435901 [Daedaleopsis nitida]|nr:hypothetical protein C8Q80DRAFT_435901 [Daedaleopsis nitida]